ncbi:MAG: helix-turn-helix domain-containing protein [Culicoidibacterales bacterium]
MNKASETMKRQRKLMGLTIDEAAAQAQIKRDDYLKFENGDYDTFLRAYLRVVNVLAIPAHTYLQLIKENNK